MSEMTRDEIVAAAREIDRRHRALESLRRIRHALNRMTRPKCKPHIRVRKLRQIAGECDKITDLGFDALSDGILINAIVHAMKQEHRRERSAEIHNIFNVLDMFQRELSE